MHPDTLRLPEPDLSKWNEEPRSTPLRTRLVKPSPVPVKRAKVIAKPTPKAKQIDCKKKTPLPFIGEKGFVSTVEVLCKRLVDESKGWLDLEEITAEFKVARRYARNRQPLSDPTRSAIIDLIYACCSNSDAKAMRWVRVMTAEFPPRPGTPEYLLPPPQTKSKSGR
ncbi:hypothetical protein A3F39_01710 [Candidatus Berkelbacteria bacterium RIFCSPHIGHO2_12_FULL_50_11]|nr:MAG: hypothetical protein A3F39_01710 [Candidatus Berkelbacteria bacterium RIFCSPHIGHO2_12_FULL_50_11]